MFGDKREKLAKLSAHQRKLSELVGEILEKADHIDRDIKERHSKVAPQWHESFAKTCQEAVHLSEAVAAIETVIKKGDVKASEKAILKSTEIAKHIFEKLSELRRGIK